MALEDRWMLMQENPIELVERVAGLMRIPTVGHRRHRLAAPLTGQPLQRPDRTRLSDRLTPRTWPRTRQPPQLLQRGRIQDRAAAHRVAWGRLGSEISTIPPSRPTRRSADALAIRRHPPPGKRSVPARRSDCG